MSEHLRRKPVGQKEACLFLRSGLCWGDGGKKTRGESKEGSSQLSLTSRWHEKPMFVEVGKVDGVVTGRQALSPTWA